MAGLPKGFLVGAATAAHQVEGNNIHSDFWAIEQIPGFMFKEPSGQCVDHYNRYKEDIDLLADADLNAYRFSIEWARIEPQKGFFDEKEVAHYTDVLNYCHQRGITPIVTMHHFSSPKWLIEEGGWENENTIGSFVNYCSFIAQRLGYLMGYVCTINEANMGLQIAKLARIGTKGGDPQVGLSEDLMAIMRERMGILSRIFSGINPADVQLFLSTRTSGGDRLIMHAHEQARDAMKAICPNLKIGVTLSIFDYQAVPGGEKCVKEELDDDFVHYLPYLQKDDFLGLQNYTRKVYGPDGVLHPPENAEMTQMNYEFYPSAVGNVARMVWNHLKLPIIITENGIATTDDARRVLFIDEAFDGITKCIDDGIPIKGYIHWSLLDNFEWMLGYDMTFGLIAVDRITQKRHPKPSLYHLGCKLEMV